MNGTLYDSLELDGLQSMVFPKESVTPSADSVRWPAEWLQSKIQEIQRVSELLPNSDSYGAYPADPHSIRCAIDRTKSLAVLTIEEPRVACLPNGNILLAWEADDDSWACELEFLPDGRIGYLLADDTNPSRNGEGTKVSLGELVHFIPGTGV